jgi:hypothetical protein
MILLHIKKKKSDLESAKRQENNVLRLAADRWL